ncbi:Uncharacterised protein [Burkholderia cenocepacia]|uniref:hypothetical protein n=1 Tax=Burkholderia cenocepacia TaxID=95486 RepID=UPI000D9C6478|nr:hypothetical protein [Burkholderia cenocepacia]SPU97183.1 Uncharacterised protein [Burkholderia cenocepacia]
MALVPIPQLPHIQPPTTYVDPDQIIALYTPKQHPGCAELILNLRGADGKVRSVFADLTVAAAVLAYRPFVPVELQRITNDVATDYHVRASAIIELAPRPDGHANLWLTNGDCKAITPAAYAAVVGALAGPAVAAAGHI